MTYLFEDRYRCERMFPRGSSGEVIEAFDLAENDRPVIIKRPVPRDAPPIRARQEANLMIERRTLQHLAGHPAVNVLLRSDYFAVSGQRHLYLVLEHAAGLPLSDLILQRSSSGQMQGRLELLRIAEQLVDLLAFAHGKGVVYNDIAARHLYWHRPSRRLTVIDWGNAVFYTEKTTNPHQIGIREDVKQFGEWLYFMRSNGREPMIPREADETFTLDFGVESDDWDEELAAIITKACHPNRNVQYSTMSELTEDLNHHQEPISQQHQAQLVELAQESPQNMSSQQLAAYRDRWQPLWQLDPSDPQAMAIQRQIEKQEAELSFSQTLQEVLGLISANDWPQAETLLDAVAGNEDVAKAAVVRGLHESVRFLKQQESLLPPLPAPIMIACEWIQAGEAVNAMETLLASDEHSDLGQTCWLLAEHLQAHALHDGAYLRPPLFRLRRELKGEPLTLLGKHIIDLENALNKAQPSLSELAAAYETLAVSLTTMAERTDLEESWQAALQRASQAAGTLSNGLQELATAASASPSAAQAELATCRAIDPHAQAWSVIEQQLMELARSHEKAESFVPQEAGRDLGRWLKDQADDLASIFILAGDARFAAMKTVVEEAMAMWQEISHALLRGERRIIDERLPQMRSATRAYYPNLARWLESWHEILNRETHLQRHAWNEALGNALSDGWLAYDSGNLKEAESLAEKALQLAQEEPEETAAMRLSHVLELAREIQSDAVKRDVATLYPLLKQINERFLPEEKKLLDDFEDLIPQLATYIRAMAVGIVAPLRNLSPAAPRLLHLRCLLLGILSIQQNDAKMAEEWRMAAQLCGLPTNHPTNECLIELQTLRETLWEVATRINQLNGEHGIAQLGDSYDYLTEHPEAETLSHAAVSLDAVRKALESWGRADFVAAGETLLRADEAAETAEHSCQFSLSPFRSWLKSLYRVSQSLHELMGKIRGSSRLEETTREVIREDTRQLRDRSVSWVGKTYSHTVNAWHEASEAFDAALTRNGRRSLVLSQLEEVFRRPYMGQHPALPWFQHRFELIDRSPEFPETEDFSNTTVENEPVSETSSHTDAAPATPYPFSQPPRAEDLELLDEAEEETIAALATEAENPQRNLQQRWLFFVFFGAIVTTLLTILFAMFFRSGSEAPNEAQFLAQQNEALDSAEGLGIAEIDVLAWLQNHNPAALLPHIPAEENEGWEFTTADAARSNEVMLAEADLDAISETGFRAVAAEFLYETEPAEEGFGVHLRRSDQIEPVFSILAQPASGGILKLTLHQNGQFVLREIHTLSVPIARISLRKDLATGEVQALINEVPIGDALTVDGDELPALFVNAGASVRVLSWKITPA